MTNMLAQLTAQAEARGADLVTLRALIEEASDLGATRAIARLGLADKRRSRTAQSNAGKPDRLESDHGGHFIAREFGGPEIRYNHFAQNARFNSSDYRTLENEWKRELKAGRRVSVDIHARYSGSSMRPYEITVQFKIKGKLRERLFPNGR
jgi:hypothetical protein